MKPKFLFFLLAVSAFSVAHSQFKVWSYDKYKLKFKMMEDMTVTINTEDRFQAKSDDYVLTIAHLTEEDVTYAGMKEDIIKFAGKSKTFKYDNFNRAGKEQPYYLRDLDHFKGIAVDGAADGQAASIALLVDPDDPDNCFLISIDYRSEYYREVLIMLNSFALL